MSRTVIVTAVGLMLLGLAVAGWKTLVLGVPVLPSDTEGLWRVELDVSARGSGRRGSVRIPLPSSGPGQVVFDERTASDRLLFTIRTERGQRLGVWSGRFEDTHDLVYGFRAQLSEVKVDIPTEAGERPPESIVSRYGSVPPGLSPSAPAVARLLEDLALPGPRDPVGRLRTLFGFVTDEIATVPTGSDDALLVLNGREGTEVGKSQLLVALLRAVGIPSRIVLGLALPADASPREEVWAEAWVGGVWIPLSPVEGWFAKRPADRVALRVGSSELIDTTGVAAVGHRWFALHERLRPEELSTLMVPPHPLLARLSLYRLPVPTQAALRALLLFPVGALVVTLFRNVIGITTFGTFMPVLVAFALRGTSLTAGLALVGGVLSVGILGRLVLDRLRLLLVPRLAVLLCMVVLCVTVAALVGRGAAARVFFAGVLFPLVILTMLIERFSVTTAEEGFRAAVVRTSWSLLVAMCVYPIFRSTSAEYLMFGFPELVFSVMGLLVLIGGYTGFRFTDLVRFRAFAQIDPGAGP